MKYSAFLPYLLVMALVTYAVRMIPLVLVKKKIENTFVLSFLHYMPYAVLSVMTVPAVFYATGNVYSAVVGVITALILAFFKRSLLLVAASASAAVLVSELIIRFVI
ncbi:MAG: AzlD domain-containing protein [Clostridia bacterium]|nr:AzlD domain-containing protein [Clostridia bacterium]